MKKRVPLNEFVILVCYGLYCLLFILETSDFDSGELGTFNRIMKYLIFITILAVTFFSQRFTVRKFAGMMVFLGVSSAIAVKCGRMADVMVTAALITSCTVLTSMKILRVYIAVSVFCILLVLAGTALGIYPNEYLVDYTRGRRYYFGFSYTTILPNFLFHLLLVCTAVRRQKITLPETVLVLAVNYLLYRYTKTRAVYYGVILLMGVLWLHRIQPKLFEGRLYALVCRYIFPVLAVTIILLSVFYSMESSFFTAADGLLSNRLKLGHQAIMDHGFSLFGQEIAWVTGRWGVERTADYYYVDSSFLNMTLSFGIITTVYVVTAFSRLTIYAYRKGNRYLSIALIFLALHAFTDPQLFELRYDPFLILLGLVTFGDPRDLLPMTEKYDMIR